MSVHESDDSAIAVYNTAAWIEANEKDFVPPVCNKCMFSDQLKVFFVGGPNSRKDFHLEEGEEIFYQIKGDMILKVVECGIHRDVNIREGELFVLPAYVEHSPQRFAGTMGCVVERERASTEHDCIRYFIDNDDDAERPSILWERWFHLRDVVKDLPPVIRAFNGSDAKTRGRPTAESFERTPPYEPRPAKLATPVNLDTYISAHLDEINRLPQQLFAGQTVGAELTLYGRGTHALISGKRSELVLLFQRGEGELHYNGTQTTIEAFFTVRLKSNTNAELIIRDGVCLVASIVPKATLSS